MSVSSFLSRGLLALSGHYWQGPIPDTLQLKLSQWQAREQGPRSRCWNTGGLIWPNGVTKLFRLFRVLKVNTSLYTMAASATGNKMNDQQVLYKKNDQQILASILVAAFWSLYSSQTDHTECITVVKPDWNQGIVWMKLSLFSLGQDTLRNQLKLLTHISLNTKKKGWVFLKIQLEEEGCSSCIYFAEHGRWGPGKTNNSR